MYWFWIFAWYSLIGFVIEKLFAAARNAKHHVRKCFLLLPLCPAYGLAMTAVLLAGAERVENVAVLVLLGAAMTTAVEYAVHWWYETVFGVRFWDYTPEKWNVNGRVCLPFSAAWGVLSALAVRFVQPELHILAAQLSDAWAGTMLVLLLFDAALTARVLQTYRDTELLELSALLRYRRGEV